MLFQFGWYFVFFLLYFIHDMSISISIHLFIYCNLTFRKNITSLAMHLSGRCSLDLVHLLRNIPSFGGWKIPKKRLGHLDDISVLSLLFHWVIFGFPERHASICSRNTSTPCLCHSLSNGRKTREFGGWPGLENEKGFQWTILNLGMKSESMCRSTRDLTCIICTWWWNSLYSYCSKCCNLMV